MRFKKAKKESHNLIRPAQMDKTYNMSQRNIMGRWMKMWYNEKIMYIVSSCLLGKNCRYDGKNCYSDEVARFLEDKLYIDVCPEILGGLNTPRKPCEIKRIKGEIRVVSVRGDDFTAEFERGAKRALKMAQEEGEKNGAVSFAAILKKRSPSCSCDGIYDGSFSNNIVRGMGIFAKLLDMNGIELLCEEDFKF